ncbi:unnamed protein product, partial [Meganyctiphanes norvegica]
MPSGTYSYQIISEKKRNITKPEMAARSQSKADPSSPLTRTTGPISKNNLATSPDRRWRYVLAPVLRRAPAANHALQPDHPLMDHQDGEEVFVTSALGAVLNDIGSIVPGLVEVEETAHVRKVGEIPYWKALSNCFTTDTLLDSVNIFLANKMACRTHVLDSLEGNAQTKEILKGYNLPQFVPDGSDHGRTSSSRDNHFKRGFRRGSSRIFLLALDHLIRLVAPPPCLYRGSGAKTEIRDQCCFQNDNCINIAQKVQEMVFNNIVILDRKYEQKECIYVYMKAKIFSYNLKKKTGGGIHIQHRLKGVFELWVSGHFEHHMNVFEYHMNVIGWPLYVGNGKVDVLSGVPQGTVLAAILFVIMIADIDEEVENSIVRSFADDTRTSLKIRTEEDKEVLQQDLNKIYRWARDNLMEFNESKFEQLSHGETNNIEIDSYKTPSENEIKPSSKVKDLGIIASDNLRFKEHIDSVVTSSKRMISLLMRTFSMREQIPMMRLFNTYIRSKLEYCCLVWSPSHQNDINKLERVLKNFTSKISGMEKLNYHERLRKLNLYSLERRRERFMIINAWQQIEGIKENILSLKARRIGRSRRIVSTVIPIGIKGKQLKETNQKF